jgi:hypothetical protein
MNTDLFIASAGSALVQLVSHWFPWNKLTGRELQAPYTYVVGVIPIVGAFTGWAAHRRQLAGIEAARGLVTITAASGLAVVGAYIIDAILGRLMTWHIGGRRVV